jgi:hypothetical protein
MALLAYGEKLVQSNWVDPHLDRQSLCAPVIDAGLDKLARASFSSRPPHPEQGRLRWQVLERTRAGGG